MDKIVQFVTGLLCGLLFPALAWLIFDIVLKITVLNRPGLPYFIAIAINLFVLRYLIRNSKELAGYGVILITFIITLLVFKFKQ